MASGKGGLNVAFEMKKYDKKYFDSYSDAEIWLLNTSKETDNQIRKEGGRYYIFVSSQN